MPRSACLLRPVEWPTGVRRALVRRASVPHRLVNRQAGAGVFSPVEAQGATGQEPFCKPICKPDAAGQAETGEMQKAGDDSTPRVGRGQRGDQRPPETAETHVGRLITQRQQMHNQDMTREYLHRTWRIPAIALQWARDHLPMWRRRPPTVGVREPRRPKPSLPAAAVALKEPRVGLTHWIKLGSRRPGDQNVDCSAAKRWGLLLRPPRQSQTPGRR
jgi:hypothetical protein